MMINILLTLVIVTLASFCVYYIWTRNIDYFRIVKDTLPNVPVRQEPPKLSYGIISGDLFYQVGTNHHGVVWRKNYSEHLFRLFNSSDQAVHDLRLVISFPAGIVAINQQSNVGCENVSTSKDTQPIKITSGNNVIAIENVLSNTFTLSIGRMPKQSKLNLDVVLDYRGLKNGYWLADLTYDYLQNGQTEKMRYLHKLQITSDNPFKINFDLSENFINKDNVFVTQESFPFNPVISKANGKFIQVDNFDGDIDALQKRTSEKGDAIMFSQGINYQIDTSFPK